MDEKQLFESAAATHLWDSVLLTQVDLTFGQELSVYYRSAPWNRAATVLDAGCGNGCYVHRLRETFGRKQYTGVDSASHLIRLASERYAMPNLTFACEDLLTFQGQYDFVVARAVLQYMKDLSAFLKAMHSLMSEDGVLLLIERADPVPYFFYPELPVVAALLDSMQAEQSKHRIGTANLFGNLRDALAVSSSLIVAEEETITVPSTVGGYKQLFKQLFKGLIEVAEATGFAETDFKAAAREWDDWCTLSESYADLRLHLVMLTKGHHVT
jgi:2-polyprenyl-3-methyl-5-hydroxy-6-metoxy-1,4-benzoquinol methylase